MKLEKPSTCEDCLAFLIGQGAVSIEDKSILNSLNRQLNKKIALTDRQFALLKGKLLNYSRLWQTKNIDESVFNNLKYPLREIDRSHWIKILRYKDEDILGIRFPFNKKVIDRIEDIRRMTLDSRPPLKFTDNTHYFHLTHRNIFGLVELAKRFETKFVIHDKIIEIYNQLLDYESNRDDYIPGVYKNEVRNIPEVAINNLEAELGKCDYDTLALYYDRRFLYGLEAWDRNDVDYSIKKYSSISQQIIRRKQPIHLIDPKLVNINELVLSITEIKRLPLLVVLENKTAHDTLFEIHNAFKYMIPAEQMSVLFRKDGEDPFNEYVKEQKLNNSVDKETKIVYISNNKMPKPLLSLIANKTWKPNSSIIDNGSRLTYNHVNGYLDNMDLRLVYDTVASGHYDRNERKYIRANM